MKTVREIKTEFELANLLEVTVKHNGSISGDAGHGGFVNINFSMENGTMLLNGEHTDEFNIEFRGSCERMTLIDALQFILDELKNNEKISKSEKINLSYDTANNTQLDRNDCQ